MQGAATAPALDPVRMDPARDQLGSADDSSLTESQRGTCAPGVPFVSRFRTSRLRLTFGAPGAPYVSRFRRRRLRLTFGAVWFIGAHRPRMNRLVPPWTAWN